MSLTDARELLEWADQKIDEVEFAAQAFFDTHPYETTEQVEGDVTVSLVRDGQSIPVRVSRGPVRTILLKLSKPLDKRIRHLTRDALQAIRAPLDYAVVAVAAGRGIDIDQARPAFPLMRDDKGFEGQVRRLKKLGLADVADFVVAQKAHAAWDDLATLHELNAHEKHRRLTAIASVGGYDTIGGFEARGVILRLPTFGSLDDGIPIVSLTGPDSYFEGNLPPIMADVAFGDIPQFGGQPCGATLRRLAKASGEVIEGLAVRFF